jgi:hypothetical protein
MMPYSYDTVSVFHFEEASMARHWINFDRLAVYEAGALLLTVLAYPDGSEEISGGVQASLCNLALRATGEMHPEWAASPRLVKPLYLLQTERDCARALRGLKRRLRDRMIAARMAYPFLKEAEEGKAIELPPSVKRLSINAMSELVLEDAKNTEPENVETRIWRPSRPVIHLATAVHGYLHLRPENEALGLGPLITRREVIEYVIRSAEHCESLVIKSGRLGVDPQRLIKFRLTGSG